MISQQSIYMPHDKHIVHFVCEMILVGTTQVFLPIPAHSRHQNFIATNWQCEDASSNIANTHLFKIILHFKHMYCILLAKHSNHTAHQQYTVLLRQALTHDTFHGV